MTLECSGWETRVVHTMSLPGLMLCTVVHCPT